MHKDTQDMVATTQSNTVSCGVSYIEKSCANRRAAFLFASQVSLLVPLGLMFAPELSHSLPGWLL